MRIALTGGIACGKSLVAKFLNELGVETIDADDIVHELIPDPAERRRIAAEVFGNETKRKELEARLHPLVKERIETFLCSPSPHTFTSHRIAVIPLLYLRMDLRFELFPLRLVPEDLRGDSFVNWLKERSKK